MNLKVKIDIPIKREQGSFNTIVFTVLLINLYRYQQKSLPYMYYLRVLSNWLYVSFLLFLFILTCKIVIKGGCRRKGTYPSQTLETST